MTSAAQQYYYPQAYAAYSTSTSPPISMTKKSTGHHGYAASADEHSMQSYGGSATSASSYAGSSSADYDYNYTSSSSSGVADGVDLMDLINNQMEGRFDPTPLDRNLVQQAQASGAMNAKHRELLALQAKAQARLARTRANFADGMKTAKQVKKDLEWTQKRVKAMKVKAEQRYPTEYQDARIRYPSPEY